ncbi:hypothetical protein ACFQU2_04345 [Siccirubricoccus deserti]
MLGCVDLATEPCTSKWSTDFALPARNSVIRRHRAPHPRGAVSSAAIADEIDIGVILIGQPVPLEVVEEARPVQREAVRLEVAHREGETVADADQRRHILGQALNEPFRNAAPGPVFAGARRR